MKSNIVSILGFVFVYQSSLFAQEPQPKQPVKTGDEWKMPTDVFQRAKTFSSGMQKKLGLDSVQEKKVYALFVANTKPLDEITVANVSEKEKDALRKANKATFNEKMKAVLSAKQYQQYLKLP